MTGIFSFYWLNGHLADTFSLRRETRNPLGKMPRWTENLTPAWHVPGKPTESYGLHVRLKPCPTRADPHWHAVAVNPHPKSHPLQAAPLSCPPSLYLPLNLTKPHSLSTLPCFSCALHPFLMNFLSCVDLTSNPLNYPCTKTVHDLVLSSFHYAYPAN